MHEGRSRHAPVRRYLETLGGRGTRRRRRVVLGERSDVDETGVTRRELAGGEQVAVFRVEVAVGEVEAGAVAHDVPAVPRAAAQEAGEEEVPGGGGDVLRSHGDDRVAGVVGEGDRAAGPLGEVEEGAPVEGVPLVAVDVEHVEAGGGVLQMREVELGGERHGARLGEPGPRHTLEGRVHVREPDGVGVGDHRGAVLGERAEGELASGGLAGEAELHRAQRHGGAGRGGHVTRALPEAGGGERVELPGHLDTGLLLVQRVGVDLAADVAGEVAPLPVGVPEGRERRLARGSGVRDEGERRQRRFECGCVPRLVDLGHLHVPDLLAVVAVVRVWVRAGHEVCAHVAAGVVAPERVEVAGELGLHAAVRVPAGLGLGRDLPGAHGEGGVDGDVHAAGRVEGDAGQVRGRRPGSEREGEVPGGGEGVTGGGPRPSGDL